ncbi:MAG: hypothetical protein DMG01_22865 [Acidobacteria bacterium]|nr:MAG: hypothetical protein DMG01_22865 [Acidobacteriota bacterium]
MFAAFLLVSCDDKPTGSHIVSFSPFPLEPSAAFAANISPQILPLTFSPLGCPLGRTFATAFDLVIAPIGTGTFFMDRVAFRLIDGSSHGTSPITVDRGVLNSMFGSTQIIGRRAFTFQPVPVWRRAASRPVRDGAVDRRPGTVLNRRRYGCFV